ncbi:MAG: amidohydrolase [Phycisphaeraceae bacterium]
MRSRLMLGLSLCLLVMAGCSMTPSKSAAPAGRAVVDESPADLVVINGLVTTQDPGMLDTTAFAVRDGLFVAVGGSDVVMPYVGSGTKVVDAGGRRVIPGLVDSHQHTTRGGRFFNLELRWDGVGSLAHGLEMISQQALRTPEGHWVRVIGGWSPFQFKERRMPTIAELNEASPDVPVFVLYLYSQGFLNRAGVEALGIDETTATPAGTRYEFVDGGAILHAEPNPDLLYGTVGRLPGLDAETQVNSAKHFYRDQNRFGLTSAIDAGGGGHNYPEDYSASQRLAREGAMDLRVSYYLFPQKRGRELEDFTRWIANNTIYQQLHETLEHGFELEGGGEFLVWAAGDFENFMADRPELSERGDWEAQLKAVTTLLVSNQWPLRIHATYGESIAQILDVFEEVRREQGRFAPRWAIDHAETATVAELRRIKAMGGGVAVQNRMSFAGEYFVERYGAAAAKESPPVRKMLEMGIPVGGGTDSTRVSSYNPWVSIHWLVTGETVGGTVMFVEENRLTRAEALKVWTVGSAWFSQEENVKGRIAAGQYADFAILDRDYFAVVADEIQRIEAVLTVVGGRAVYATDEMADQVSVAELPAAEPAWSPVNYYGGYQRARR